MWTRRFSFDIQSDIDENPPWRSDHSSSKMLENIIGWVTDWQEKEDALRLNNVLVQFVWQSNIGEDVGTQTLADTNKLLQQSLNLQALNACTREDRETVNIFQALERLDQIHTEMEHTGLITVQQICETHAILMKGLHPNSGKIRETVAYTVRPNGEIHYYPPPDVLEKKLYLIVDWHNMHMEEINSLTNINASDKLALLIKCTAWLLINFVETHPFSDGNGRMCRLLAGYVIGVVNPFPVHPYHLRKSSVSSSYRRDYINAIIQRDTAQMSALLVDGLYSSWEKYLEE